MPNSLIALLGGSVASLLLLTTAAHAMPDGLAQPCGGCHELVGGPKITLDVDAASVDPGTTLTLVVDLQTTKADALRTGLWLTADGGEFQLIEPDTKLETATSVLHSAPRDLVNGHASLSFAWTAPLGSGVTEFTAWSIVGNNNGTPRDDPFTRSTFAVAYGCSGRGFFPDLDVDGFGDDLARVFTCGSPPLGLIETGGDCNDRSELISPAAAELCNLSDDNCNGQLDEDVAPTLLYPDTDGDGFGVNAGDVQLGCGVEGFSPILGDCSDFDAAISPGAVELINGIDDDCDGQIDEAGALPIPDPAMNGEPPLNGDPSGTPAAMTNSGSSGCSLVQLPRARQSGTLASARATGRLHALPWLGLLLSVLCFGRRRRSVARARGDTLRRTLLDKKPMNSWRTVRVNLTMLMTMV